MPMRKKSNCVSVMKWVRYNRMYHGCAKCLCRANAVCSAYHRHVNTTRTTTQTLRRQLKGRLLNVRKIENSIECAFNEAIRFARAESLTRAKQSETGLSQGLPRNNSVTITGMPKRPMCTMLLIEDNCSGLELLPHKRHDLHINAVDATT
jgi:hypothetical protein